MVKQLYRTIKGLADASLKTPSGKLLVLPTAAGAVFSPGQKIQTIEGSSRLGEMVINDSYLIGREPEIKLDWKQKNLTLIGMQLGQEFLPEASVDTKIISNGFLVTRNTYAPVESGAEGYGMTADQVGSIAYHLLDDEVVEPLTQQDFADFAPATPKSFAQGANGAMKFSNDLINRYVAYEFPHLLANAIKLSEEDFISFELRMNTIMTDRSILQWYFPSVAVKLETGDIDMTKPEMSITFRVQDDGRDCIPYSVVYKGKAQQRKCA